MDNSTDNPKQKLKELYQALRDKPLNPADSHDAKWYEPYIASLETDPIAHVAAEISFNDAESLYFVTGQRGTGKSTELLRLRKMLLDDGFVVFYVDMLDYLHMSEPAEISDFLMAVSIGLAKQANTEHGLGITEDTLWEGLQKFFGSLELDKVSLKASLKLAPAEFGADLTARLRSDHVFKKELQLATRGHTAALVENVRDFAISLVVALRKKYHDNGKQIALIVDSFEQIRGHYENVDKVYESIIKLFGSDGKHLRLPMMHTIITVPPYLTHAAPGVTKSIGNIPVSLPNVHIRQRYSNEPDQSGLDTLKNMIYRRTDLARFIFDDAALESMAIASGGDLRDFFSLVSNALVTAGTRQTIRLPLGVEFAELSRVKLQRSMLPINDMSVRWLYKVNQTTQPELSDKDKLPELAALFDNNLIINYRNGEDWYGIHPLIVDYVLERQRELDKRDAKVVHADRSDS